MKKLILLGLTLVAAPSFAQSTSLCTVAGPCANLGKNWGLGLSLDPWQGYMWGGRDYYNGKFAAGYGYEAGDLYHNGKNLAYISVMHIFNSVQDSRGAIGLNIGIRPINLINGIASFVAGVPGDLVTLPPWLQNIGNWVSLDTGYAYKMQQALPGESRNEFLIGGKVQKRFDLTAPH